MREEWGKVDEEINLGGESQSRPEPWPPAIADDTRIRHFVRPLFDLRGGGQVSLGEGKVEAED